MSILISKEDAIDAWWHDEVFFGNQRDDMTKEQWLDYITDVIDSLPSTDAVQIPIKLEKRYPQSRDEDITDAFMRGYLAGRSSADRPTGEWIEINNGIDTTCECSKCHYRDYIPNVKIKPNKYECMDRYWFERKFCPVCGAKILNMNYKKL